jgi:hemolysin III
MRDFLGSRVFRGYSPGEEIVNAVSHGVGAALAVAALVFLILRAAVYAPRQELAFYMTGFSVFGGTLVVLYLNSTLYHALTPRQAKNVFALFDHASIYLLIAGTYTAFCLSTLRGPLGYSLLGIIWVLALGGIVCYVLFGGKMRFLSLFTYLPMGWLIIAAAKPVYRALPRVSFLFLFLGGAAYTVGTLFYGLKKIKWMHCVWHGFVLAGSVLHFCAVMTLIGAE